MLQLLLNKPVHINIRLPEVKYLVYDAGQLEYSSRLTRQQVQFRIKSTGRQMWDDI